MTHPLDFVRAKWEVNAQDDPMFRILSDMSRANGGWTQDEFFAHGRAEMVVVMAYLDEMVPRRQTRRALDFGCGIGRCTRALVDYYDQVDGVDISGGMIDLAKEMTFESVCQYHRNDGDLTMFDGATFDLIYSRLTMQHIPADFVLDYLDEFARVLKIDGVMFVEIRNCDYARPSDFEIQQRLDASRMRVLNPGWVDQLLAQRVTT